MATCFNLFLLEAVNVDDAGFLRVILALGEEGGGSHRCSSPLVDLIILGQNYCRYEVLLGQ